jgi:hypothetical protein
MLSPTNCCVNLEMFSNSQFSNKRTFNEAKMEGTKEHELQLKRTRIGSFAASEEGSTVISEDVKRVPLVKQNVGVTCSTVPNANTVQPTGINIAFGQHNYWHGPIIPIQCPLTAENLKIHQALLFNDVKTLQNIALKRLNSSEQPAESKCLGAPNVGECRTRQICCNSFYLAEWAASTIGTFQEPGIHIPKHPQPRKDSETIDSTCTTVQKPAGRGVRDLEYSACILQQLNETFALYPNDPLLPVCPPIDTVPLFYTFC